MPRFPKTGEVVKSKPNVSPPRLTRSSSSPIEKLKSVTPKKVTALKDIEDLSTSTKDWKLAYDKIKAYRLAHPSAPVDTIGCDRLFTEKSSPETRRFQILLSLLLSSQTKDEVTAAAMKQLHERLGSSDGQGVTVDAVLAVEESELNACISKVGFHRKKTVFMKQAAMKIKHEWNGDLPNDAQQIMELAGVGPKMAYLFVQAAYGGNEGIGVDTHVHRISYRLRWSSEKVWKKGPECTRLHLQQLLPKECWREVNTMLVGYGQTVCLPINPLCGQCVVADVCPSRSCKR